MASPFNGSIEPMEYHRDVSKQKAYAAGIAAKANGQPQYQPSGWGYPPGMYFYWFSLGWRGKPYVSLTPPKEAEAMSVSRIKPTDKCADCGADNPHMHNSREVKPPLWGTGPVTQRFPGFLCHECWKKANPVLFPGNPSMTGKAKVNPAWIVWGLFFATIAAGIIAGILVK